MELRLRTINVGSSHQVRESHEVAEPVDDGARDEMSSPHEEKGRVDPEDGGVSELKKKKMNLDNLVKKHWADIYSDGRQLP